MELNRSADPRARLDVLFSGMVINIPSHLSDDELDSALKRLAARERDATAELDACLAELKSRNLPIPEGLKAALEDREALDPETE